MRYLCLIYLDEKAMDALPPGEMHALNAGHLELNDQLRASGHLVAAEALQPAREATCIRARPGKSPLVTDGPFAETKEQLGGFYLLEARDLNEAIQIATQFPGGRHGVVEVRAVRRLEAEGRSP